MECIVEDKPVMIPAYTAMTATTQDADGVDELMSMREEADAYADGAWDCEVLYVCEGGTEESERFFDLGVSGETIPSGLLHNLQTRGYTISAITFDEHTNQQVITATPN